MYLLTVLLRSTPQLMQFHYKQFKDADKALLNAHNAEIMNVEDDYGSKAKISREELAGIFLTDLSLEMEAHEIVELAKMKKDLRVRKKQMEDPAMRLMVPERGGMA